MKFSQAGAHNELVACGWLLRQGYEVFRNVSPFGDVDLIAINGSERFEIDVKGVTSATARVRLSPQQIARGVIVLCVHDGECWLDRRPLSKTDLKLGKDCERCGDHFTPGHPRQRYCADRCRARAYQRKTGTEPQNRRVP